MRRIGRLTPATRAALAIIATAGLGLLASGCGGGSSASPTASTHENAALVYSRCVRSHGVPNFPDPGASFPSGVAPQSPAFRDAEHACRQLNPKPSPVSTRSSARQRQAALGFALCMRTHGYPRFPDPTPNLPTTPSGTVLGAFNVYFVLEPATGTHPHSTAFIHTATAGGVNPLGPAPR
jgi:hypothetical protein